MAGDLLDVLTELPAGRGKKYMMNQNKVYMHYLRYGCRDMNESIINLNWA